jgi:hypothetical protein
MEHLAPPKSAGIHGKSIWVSIGSLPNDCSASELGSTSLSLKGRGVFGDVTQCRLVLPVGEDVIKAADRRIELVYFPATAYNPDSLKSWYGWPKKTIRPAEPPTVNIRRLE